MTMADCRKSETSHQCTLDLCVYEDDFGHGVKRVNSQSRSQTDNAKKLQKTEKMLLTSSSRVKLPSSHQSANHYIQAKRHYTRRYLSKWKADPSLKDWIAPVSGDVYKARCMQCNVVLPADYQQLKAHAVCDVHVNSSSDLLNNTVNQLDNITNAGDTRSRILYKKLIHVDLYKKLAQVEGTVSHENGEEVTHASKTVTSSYSGRIADDADDNDGGGKKDDNSDAAATTGRARLKTKSSCYMLSQSQWERYRQKYRSEWENDPVFQGWIAPVSGDVYKARCLYCRVMVRAHYKDLKSHARTAKHANSVTHNQPGCIANLGKPADKPLLNRKRAFGPQRTTRFDSLHKTHPLTATGLNAHDVKEEAILLAPDDSLASHTSLVSMAVYPSGQPIPQNVTTLLMPNRTALDETVAASLLPATPDYDNTMYRVKKLRPSSTERNLHKSKSDAGDSGNSCVPSLYRAARGITLWEFLRLKVRQDSDRPNSMPRLAQMIGEFDALQQQLRSVVQDQLVPVSTEPGCMHPSSKILVIQSEELAKSLGLKTGQYFIKQSPNEAPDSQPWPRKRRHKNRHEKQSTVKPENSPTSAGGTGNWVVRESVTQPNNLEELIDPQKLIEFAVSSANAKDIDDFEPTQMMQSDYFEGPVIKIEEFPGSMPEISGGTSVAADEALLCYIAQSSQSSSNLAAISDNTEHNLSFKQSLMVTSVPVTQSSTLTFPLTLTVDGTAVDSCSPLQFS